MIVSALWVLVLSILALIAIVDGRSTFDASMVSFACGMWAGGLIAQVMKAWIRGRTQ